ncbi:MAG: uncharacterized membrane protein YuzA (DUF378 family) [Glaciecola sp.]|jgi:uncharacterized membrane protein YuzA (DUF378 family)
MGEKIVIGIAVVFALVISWYVGFLIWSAFSKDERDPTIGSSIVYVVIGVIALGMLSTILKFVFAWDSNADL